MTLVVGQAKVLKTGSVRRIAVGNGKVMQATSLDKRQVLILPEAVGQTSLHLWPRRGPLKRYLINIVADDVGQHLLQVQAMLGSEENLKARLAGETVVLEGHSLSALQKARIDAVMERHPNVLNLASDSSTERMIAMDVRMIEMKKSALKNIGIRWSGSANGPSFGVVGDFHRSGGFSSPEVAAAAGMTARRSVAPFATAFSLAGSITSMLDFLVTRGDAVILAEPRLSCRSGGTARFVAGGELPIPQSSGLGAVSVAFKEYGVKFDFSPVAGQGGMISARIATEISAIDFEVMVNDVPGLIKRRAETEVNLRENQTLVIAGLLAEDASRKIDQVAGLGDIPVLGELFKSRDFRSQKTDLVVFVTPRFVENQQPKLPPVTVPQADLDERANKALQRLSILD
ncbi:MAG: type II and III secretion system protein family protein [Burkholderiaceae bacterium]